MNRIAHPSAFWRIDSQDLSADFSAEDNCALSRLPDNLGQGTSSVYALAPALNYIETRFQPSRDLAVWARTDVAEPRMVVTLALQGQSRYTPNQGESIVFREGYTSVTIFNSSEGVREYAADQVVTQLRFAVNMTWLAQTFGADRLPTLFEPSARTRQVSLRPISSAGLTAAQALLRCPVSSPTKSLFRQGQALAILATELDHLFGEASDDSGSGQRDRDIAHQARAILHAEFVAPPTVEELARRLATNPCKLKQLFHRYFETTPYGMLLEIRMREAHRLLEAGRQPIGLIAESVGYHHASNFSTAFTRYFGYPPKRIAKRD